MFAIVHIEATEQPITPKHGAVVFTICHQIIGSLYPFQNWHMHTSSNVQF